MATTAAVTPPVAGDRTAAFDKILEYIEACVIGVFRSPLVKAQYVEEYLTKAEANLLPILLLYKEKNGWKKGSVLHKEHLAYIQQWNDVASTPLSPADVDYDTHLTDTTLDSFVEEAIESKNIYSMLSMQNYREMLVDLLFGSPVTWMNKAWIVKYCPNGARHYYQYIAPDVIFLDFIRPVAVSTLDAALYGKGKKKAAAKAAPAASAATFKRVIQVKMNGRRCLLSIFKHVMVMMTRGGHKTVISRSVLKDRRRGRIVAPDDYGTLYYVLDGECIAADHASRRPAAESVKVGFGTMGFYIAFDVLYAPIIKEKDKRIRVDDALYEQPLRTRLVILEKIVRQYSRAGIEYSDGIALGSRQFIWMVPSIDIDQVEHITQVEEGIVVKDANKPYWMAVKADQVNEDRGEQTDQWWKYKTHDQTADVIFLNGNWTDKSSIALGMYLLGSDGEYISIGQVSSLTKDDIRKIVESGITDSNNAPGTPFSLLSPLYASVLFDRQDEVIRHPRIVEWRDASDDVNVTLYDDVFA